MKSLKLIYRLFIYVITVIFSVLSLIDVVFHVLPNFIDITIYVFAGLSLCISCYDFVIHVSSSLFRLKNYLIKKYKFINLLYTDYRYRTFMMTCSGCVMNIMFAFFNGIIGLMNHSAWFVTLSIYYAFLSIMRLMVIRYELKLTKLKQTKSIILHEVKIQYYCGVLLVLMTLILIGTIILLVRFEGRKYYSGYIIFIVAGYTFYKIIASLIQLITIKKLKSLLLKTIRYIGYVDACISVLLLESAMLSSFGKGDREFEIMIYLISGIVICLMVFLIGIHCMISSRKMKRLIEVNNI